MLPPEWHARAFREAPWHVQLAIDAVRVEGSTAFVSGPVVRVFRGPAELHGSPLTLELTTIAPDSSESFPPGGSIRHPLVNLRVGRHVYRLDLFGACPDVSWTNSLALVTTGSSSVCTGRGLGTSIMVRGSTGPQRCAIQSITALTTAEVQALEPRFRP